MAEIYLHHRKDKRMYAQCYRQIVEKSPTAQSYILLGDAYMAIQGIDYISPSFASKFEFRKLTNSQNKSKNLFFVPFS